MINKKSKKRKVGRPLIYSEYLKALDDETVYCPASIVDNAIKKGLISDQLSDAKKANLRHKVRNTLSQFAKSHCFPSDGDGMVDIKGHKQMRGWKGLRWKKAAGLSLEGDKK